MDRYDELIRTDVFGMPVHKMSVAHIHLTAKASSDLNSALHGEKAVDIFLFL